MKQSPEFERDLAFYKRVTCNLQAESDALNDWLGMPRVDLAYAKAREREARRAMPTTTDMMQAFRDQIELVRYARAVSLENYS
jgi:hypothetical protein